MIVDDDQFCQSPFWDEDLTWNTNNPVLTPCFESTVLTLIPVVFLWSLSLLLTIRNRPKDAALPYSYLSVVKYLLTALLSALFCVSFLLDLLDASRIISTASITSDILKALTCILALITQIADTKRGRTSSIVLFIFWFLFLLCSLPTYYRMLLIVFTDYSQQPSSLEYLVSVVSFPVILVEFVLSTISEPKPFDLTVVTPVLKASPLSAFVFEWFTPMIVKGFKTVVTLVDLFPALPDLKARNNYNLWTNSLEEDNKLVDSEIKRQSSLFWSLAKTFWIPVAIASFYEIMFVVLRMFPALILNLIIDFMSSDEQVWKGYLYASGILIVSLSSTMFIRHGDYIMILTGLRIKSVLVSAVYRKLLRISSTSLSKYTVGEIVNLVSVDADKIYQLSMYIAMAIGAPINILLPIFLLWQYLGPSCLAGIAVIVLMMPITAGVVHKCSSLQEAQMQLKDDRLKNSGEVLNSIKILKFYAWEVPFIDKIQSIRSKEISILTKYAYYSAVLRFFWTLTPFLVSLFAFMTFVLVSDQNILDPSTAFVSLTLFNSMRFAISFIPDIISNIVQTTVSMKRIAELLDCEDSKEDAIGNNPQEDEVITISRANLTWNGNHPILKEISFSVKKGQLIAIVGEVGSGKSSLLSALLGDMLLISGSIDLKGSLAYVPQQAWIQNTTVKQNILFTSPPNQKYYNKVLDVCCLGPDIDMLPGGDLTEIGEKGVNLSGGQKQRISLARAVYQDKNIYLLDDPLSAVDAHVGTAIFDNVIGPRGILRRKTRIMVTNNLYILPYADYIVVLKNGSILESGTYYDLEDNKEGKLSELIQEYQQGELEYEEESAEGKERTISEMRMEHYTQSLSSTDTSQYGDRGVEFLLIKEEAVETGSIKRGIYIKYLRYLGFGMAVVILFGFTGFRVFDIVGGIWLSAWSSDKPLPRGDQDIELRNTRMIVYAFFGVLQGIFSFFGTAMLAKGAVTASKKLHNRMLLSLMKAPMSFFDTTPFGRILNRLGKDVDQLDIQLPVVANLLLELLFQVIGMIALISVNVPIYIAIAVPVLAVFMLIQRVYLNTLRQLKRLESVSRSPVFNHFSETVSGLSSIRGYKAQESFIKRCDERLDTTQNCSYLLMVAQRWMTTRLDVLGNLLNFTVAVIVIIYRENMDPGTAGLLISYSLNTAFAFNYLIHYGAEVETAVVAAERIDEYTKIPSEAEWSLEPKPSKEWPNAGAVEFQNYCTRYREGLELVLHDVSLYINPGEKVGVVGRTGAGKSSLTLSLFRIIEPVSGNILIDGINTAKLGLHDLRPKLTIIPQDPVLFSGTLRLNLDPADEYNDDQLWAALSTVNMKDPFVDGLESEVSEGGQNLSVGQRQLLCLARAILRKTKILILDEATAAVDMETDAFVQETIRRDFADCTIITIAHRLYTILDSDKVIVMASGRIVESGSPSDLLKDKTSEFYDMASEAGIV